MMSVGVSIPLPWDRANRQDRDVSAKLAFVDQARALREDALRAHVAEVAAMLEEWENGRERLALYADSLLPLARERTAAAVAAYRGGKGTLADVLAARRNELDVRRDALMLERETARLWAQLNYLDITHGIALPTRRSEGPAMKTATFSIIAVLGAVALGAGGYWLGRGHCAEACRRRGRRRPRPPARRARRRSPATSIRRRAARSCTGTTRWCRASASTSPASRRS